MAIESSEMLKRGIVVNAKLVFLVYPRFPFQMVPLGNILLLYLSSNTRKLRPWYIFSIYLFTKFIPRFSIKL